MAEHENTGYCDFHQQFDARIGANKESSDKAQKTAIRAHLRANDLEKNKISSKLFYFFAGIVLTVVGGASWFNGKDLASIDKRVEVIATEVGHIKTDVEKINRELSQQR